MDVKSSAIEWLPRQDFLCTSIAFSTANRSIQSTSANTIFITMNNHNTHHHHRRHNHSVSLLIPPKAPSWHFTVSHSGERERGGGWIGVDHDVDDADGVDDVDDFDADYVNEFYDDEN